MSWYLMVFRKITYSIFSLVFHFIFLHLISFATKHHKDVYDSQIKPWRNDFIQIMSYFLYDAFDVHVK